MTEVGEVYLCLLGVNDLALILVASGLAPRCLARGGVTEIALEEQLAGNVPERRVPGERLAVRRAVRRHLLGGVEGRVAGDLAREQGASGLLVRLLWR